MVIFAIFPLFRISTFWSLSNGLLEFCEKVCLFSKSLFLKNIPFTKIANEFRGVKRKSNAHAHAITLYFVCFSRYSWHFFQSRNHVRTPKKTSTRKYKITIILRRYSRLTQSISTESILDIGLKIVTKNGLAVQFKFSHVCSGLVMNTYLFNSFLSRSSLNAYFYEIV